MKFVSRRLARCFGCSEETPNVNSLRRSSHSTNYDLEALKLHISKHNDFDINSKNLDIIWLVQTIGSNIFKFSSKTFWILQEAPIRWLLVRRERSLSLGH